MVRLAQQAELKPQRQLSSAEAHAIKQVLKVGGR